MGQPIEVTSTVVGQTAIFDTDRTITGQDGSEFDSAESAAGDDFPDQLARQLFAADDAVASVFIASNVVTVARTGGWGDGQVAAAAKLISEFFVFYD